MLKRDMLTERNQSMDRPSKYRGSSDSCFEGDQLYRKGHGTSDSFAFAEEYAFERYYQSQGEV